MPLRATKMSVDYQYLWDTCEVILTPKRADQLEEITDIIKQNKDRYESVQLKTVNLQGRFIPWPLIACIHFRETNLDFTKHLHNGDPLTARTTHVPAGRPTFGEPPFEWEESAADALSEFHRPPLWTIDQILRMLEKFNGTGYQKHDVSTPYLWDYTCHYLSGLYTSDGRFDPAMREDRPGCVIILKVLQARGVSLEPFALSARPST